MLLSALDAFPADVIADKKLFIVQVPALKPIAKTEEASPSAKGTPSPVVTSGTVVAASATESEKKTESFAPSGFTLESSASREVSVEVRAQQIEAMNGTPLLRPSPRSSRTPSGISRALDLLLPPGKAMLSKNPNARRDPLRILEE